MAKLHSKNRALDAVHAVVEAAILVFVARFLAPRTQQPDLLRDLWITRHDRAAFTVGAEILAWVKAETADLSDRSAPLALVLGAVRLTRILDHHQTVLSGDRHDWIHVRRLPEQVHGNDRFGPRCNRGLELLRIHREELGLDVDEHRLGARILDRSDGGDERERNRDHLVARSNT